MPLLYQPGDRWVYSVAHDVQAALVEKLSGQKFDEFVRQRIFTPLEMNDSMFKVPADKKSRVPALYSHGPRRQARGRHQPAREATTATRCSAATASRRRSATTRSSRRCC